MAVANEVIVTREMVMSWIASWRRLRRTPKPTLREWLEVQLVDMGYSDTRIDHHGAPLIDVVMDDLRSYGADSTS